MQDAYREIRLSEICKPHIRLSAAVKTDNDGYQILIVKARSTELDDFDYEISFNVDWIETEKRVDWLAEVLASNLGDNIREARRDLSSQIRRYQAAIADLVGFEYKFTKG